MEQHTTARYMWQRAPGSPAWNRVHHTQHPETPLVMDDVTKNVRTINDPHFGGLFAFGIVAARPPLPHDKNEFWNHCWEFTSRTLSRQPTEVETRGAFILPGETEPCLELEWKYEFAHKMDGLTAQLTVTPPRIPRNDIWYKEPKLSFNGLLGYRTITVYDAESKRLAEYDLTKFTNPVRKTCQIPHPLRYRYILRRKSTQFPQLSITFAQKQWNPWRIPAENAEPLSNLAMYYDGSVKLAPKYCLTPQGRLKAQTEVPRWGKDDLCGVAIHGWEGGYGAPDCWNTFRPWPRNKLTLRATVRFS